MTAIARVLERRRGRDGRRCGSSSGRGPTVRQRRRAPSSSSAGRGEPASSRGWTPDGRRIALLDDRGRPRAHARAGHAGSSPPRASGDQAPTWVVTGTDDAGVAAAAAAIDEDRLDGPLRARDRGRARRRPAGRPERRAPMTYRRRREPAARGARGRRRRRGASRSAARRAVARAPAAARRRAGRRASAAGALARRGRPRAAGAARWAMPFALIVALVNAARRARRADGDRARLGRCRGSGTIDITLEATVYGLVLGLRALRRDRGLRAATPRRSTPTSCCALFRRVSFRSALTATLATRLVPVLARDARRLRDAQRCRPGGPASRAGARAGGGGGRAGPRGRRRGDARGPRLRRAGGAAAAAARGPGRATTSRSPRRRPRLAVLGAAARGSPGWRPFEAYPLTRAPVGRAVLGARRGARRRARCCRSPTAGGSGG